MIRSSFSATDRIETPRDALPDLISWLRDYAGRMDTTEMNRRGASVHHVMTEFGRRGILGAVAACDVGGLGLTEAGALRLLQQIAALDLSLAACTVLHYASSICYGSYARPRVREVYLSRLASGSISGAFALTEPAAGSNPRALKTTVQRAPDGRFVLDGKKTWCGNAEWATVITCFARDGSGRVSAFAVPADSQGVSIGPDVGRLGVRGMVLNDVTFSSVRVDADHLLGELGEGLSVAERSLSFGRLAAGAMALGGMKRCAQVMERFASRRRISTGRLIDNGVTRERLFATHGAIASLEALLDVLLDARASAEPPPGEGCMALKVVASELLWETVDATIQLLGARGYAESNGICTMLRDARFLRLGEGPTEALLMQVGAAALHGEADVRGFVRRLVGPGADRQLDELAERALQGSGRERLERYYYHVGWLVTWQLMAAASARAGIDPMAQAFVAQRLEDVERRIGEIHSEEATGFDSLEWARGLAAYVDDVGSLDGAWPIPQCTRDPYLRDSFEESGGKSTEPPAAELRVCATGAFGRSSFPTDGAERSGTAPRTWTAAEPVCGGEHLACLERMANQQNVGVADVLLVLFGAFIGRFSGEREVPVTRIECESGSLPSECCVPASPQLSSEILVKLFARSRTSGAAESTRSASTLRPEVESGSGPRTGVWIGFGYVGADPRGTSEHRFDGIDLQLICSRDGAGSLHAAWTYDPDLFLVETIERRHSNFQVFLRAAISDVSAPLGSLELLTDGERARVVDGWNGAPTDPAFYEHTLHRLVASQADRTPDGVALVAPDRQYSYREVDSASSHVAGLLRSRGIRRGDSIAVCATRSPALVIGALASLKAGGRLVLLNGEHPLERQRGQLDLSGARALIVDATTVGNATLLHSALPVVRADVDPSQPSVPFVDETTPADIAYISFTSGTTGRPKGILISHRAACNQMRARRDRLDLTSDDRVLQAAAPNFDIAVWELLGPLVFGGSIVLGGADRFTWDPVECSRLIDRHAVTVMQIVPSQLSLLLEQGGIPHSLRHVICGGERLSPSLMQRFFAQGGRGLWNFYGPAEAAIDATCWECVPGDAEREVPIGRGLTNRRLYVLDDLGEPVPIGVPGELYLGGVGVGEGYIDEEELTARHFLPDPFATSPARMYRTGDRVRYRADGALMFLGRTDRQVKIRGVRVELEEIESKLQEHTGVSGCAVTLVEDHTGDRRLVAYVSLREGASVGSDELRDTAASSLPSAVVPNAFVILDALPMTASGKVDFDALPRPEWEHHELREASNLADPVEQTIAEIWCQLLGVAVDRSNADFFDLGGHSLLAVQMLARVRERLGVEVSIRELLEVRSLTELAKRVRLSLEPCIGRRPMGHRTPTPRLYVLDSLRWTVDSADSVTEVGDESKTPLVPLYLPPTLQLNSVEEAADRHFELLRTDVTLQDVRLAAWSSDTLIAFELARRIERSGGSVAALILVDPFEPGHWAMPMAASTSLIQCLDDLAAACGTRCEVDPSELSGLNPEGVLVRARLEGNAILSRATQPTRVTPKILDDILASADAVRRICASYRPRGRLHGTLVLARRQSGRGADRAREPSGYGWLEYVELRACAVELDARVTDGHPLRATWLNGVWDQVLGGVDSCECRLDDKREGLRTAEHA